MAAIEYDMDLSGGLMEVKRVLSNFGIIFSIAKSAIFGDLAKNTRALHALSNRHVVK